MAHYQDRLQPRTSPIYAGGAVRATISYRLAVVIDEDERRWRQAHLGAKQRASIDHVGEILCAMGRSLNLLLAFSLSPRVRA